MSLSSEESEDELDLVNVPRYVELERPDPAFIREPWLASTPNVNQKKPKPVVISLSVAGSLDHTKMSDCNATYVLASAAKSLDHDISKITFSRQSI